jgi:O-antigen/teichoic acid export membrane protein
VGLIATPVQPILPQESTIGTKIVRNTASGALRLVVLAPIPFLLTPFLLRHVGTTGFGIWAVLLSFNGLTALADLGVTGTLTKHVSEHYTRQDYATLNRLINAGILMFSVLAMVCALTVKVAAGFLISVFFRQSLLPVFQFQHAIRLLSVAIALNLLAFPFASVISGLQRLELTNLLWALNAIITASAAAVFVSLGRGILGLVDAIVLTSVILFLLNVIVAWRLFPQLRIRPGLVRLADIKALSAFSLQVYVVQVASAVYFYTEKLLLAHFVGPTPVGWYEIGNDLAMKFRNAPALLMMPLMPAAAELEAHDDDARTSELYYRAHKYLAFIGVAVFVVVALLAHRFIELWLGPGFSASARAHRTDGSTNRQPCRFTRAPDPGWKGNSGACSSLRLGGHVRHSDPQYYFDLALGFPRCLVRHCRLSLRRRGLPNIHVPSGDGPFEAQAVAYLRETDAVGTLPCRVDVLSDFSSAAPLAGHDHHSHLSRRRPWRGTFVVKVFRRF